MPEATSTAAILRREAERAGTPILVTAEAARALAMHFDAVADLAEVSLEHWEDDELVHTSAPTAIEESGLTAARACLGEEAASNRITPSERRTLMYPASCELEHDALHDAVRRERRALVSRAFQTKRAATDAAYGALEATALAAQQLVIAVDAGPAENRPAGWVETGAELAEARALATAALAVLREMPCGLDELDPAFACLPEWAGGEAETGNGQVA